MWKVSEQLDSISCNLLNNKCQKYIMCLYTRISLPPTLCDVLVVELQTFFFVFFFGSFREI